MKEINIKIKKPTKEELEDIIKPLIPTPLKGDDGKTPKKGVEYFTKAEQKEFVQEVLSLIDVPKVDYKQVKAFITEEISKIPKPEVKEETPIDLDSIALIVLSMLPKQKDVSEEVQKAVKELNLEEIMARSGRFNSPGVRMTMDEISDVDTEGLEVDQVLKWNGSKWIPYTVQADTDEKTKVSANDTTAGYLNGKLVAGTGITLQVNDDGENETLEIINSLSSIVVDTKATILASTPTSETVAYATDTKQFYVFDGTNWQESSSYFGERNASPSIGAEQDTNTNNVGRDFIFGKKLSDTKIGGYLGDLSNRSIDVGAIKGDFDSDTGDFEMYLWSTDSETWRRFLSGISLRNDLVNKALVTDDFTHTINLFTGDSFALDGNGLPMVQRGKTSVGANQYPVVIEGGSF